MLQRVLISHCQVFLFQYLKDVALLFSHFHCHGKNLIIPVFVLYGICLFLWLLLRFSLYPWFWAIWLWCALVRFLLYVLGSCWVSRICGSTVFLESGKFQPSSLQIFLLLFPSSPPYSYSSFLKVHIYQTE